MNVGDIDFSSFPYPKFSEIRIRNNEPLTYAFLNSHIVKLCSNLESLGITNTLQKATYSQWGTVKFAKETDITGYSSEDGDSVKTSVLTNDVLNRVMDRMRNENADTMFREGTLSISKNYEIRTGSFLVGTNEKIAKKITNSPESVMFTKIELFPIGFDDTPFYTTRTATTDKSSFSKGIESSGILNFKDWGKPSEYNEFHVYYHTSGYVICNNGKVDNNHKQVKVVWTQLVMKS